MKWLALNISGRRLLKFRAYVFKTRGQGLWSNIMPSDLKYCVWPVTRRGTAAQKLLAGSGEANARLKLFMMNNNTNKIALILQTIPPISFTSAKYHFPDRRCSLAKPPLSYMSPCPYLGRLYVLLDLSNKVYLCPSLSQAQPTQTSSFERGNLERDIPERETSLSGSESIATVLGQWPDHELLY